MPSSRNTRLLKEILDYIREESVNDYVLNK